MPGGIEQEDEVVRFETPRGARVGEVMGAGCVTVAFWLLALSAAILVGVLAGTWIGDEYHVPLVLAVSAAAIVLWAWPRWLWRRLVFSVTLRPEGIVFGSWAGKPLPYGAVELVRTHRRNVDEGNDRWVEITVAGVKRRLFLGAQAAECAREVFRRSRGAVLIDDNEEEHFHVDTPRPLENLKMLFRGYRRRGYAHLLAGGAMLVVSAFPLFALVRWLFGEEELTSSLVKGAVVFLLLAVAWIGLGVYYVLKAGRFRDALDRLEAGGTAEAAEAAGRPSSVKMPPEPPSGLRGTGHISPRSGSD